MNPMNDKYDVYWGRDAEKELLTHKKYLDVKAAYRNALIGLSRNPYEQREGIIEYPGFEFNGYLYAKFNNVLVAYRIDEASKKVFIDGCESALTGNALKYFYTEYDPEDE